MRNVRHRYLQADFYISIGDSVEHPMNCCQDEAYWSVDSVVPTKPVLVSSGSHEYVKRLVCVLERRFACVSSYLFELRYKNNNVYFVDYNDTTIITLDNNRDPWFLFSQRERLERTLRVPERKWEIVILHHPVYSMKGKTSGLAVCWIFDGLFREYGIDLALQGHGHNYARMTDKNGEDEMTTPSYLVSHAPLRDYRLSFNDKYDRFGTNRRFYQHIDVTGDTLRVQAYLENNLLYNGVHIMKGTSDTQIIDNAKNIPEISEMPVRLSGKKAEEFRRNIEKWGNRFLVE